MEGFSLIIYALTALGIMKFIQTVLTGLVVVATVLYFMKRA